MHRLMILLLLLCAAASPAQGENLSNVSADDPEMNAAIAEAQKSLPRFLQAWAAGQVGDTANLKVAFPLPEGHPVVKEHIWVERFVRHADGSFGGQLGNEPEYLPI